MTNSKIVMSSRSESHGAGRIKSCNARGDGMNNEMRATEGVLFTS